ncbi:molybdate ABC transporter substrate-binding protein [Helicobacter pylori]|uniref:molybdate ABC transporter substrate-binding protein n=1 Tax=Helicobacter pylori TaxID=210 RepID=UPI003145061D
MKNTFKAFAFLIVFFSSALLAQDLKIAVATNLTRALKALVKEFQKEHSKDAISISALILQANSTLKSFKTPLLIYSFQQILLGLKSFMVKKITPFKEEVYAKGVLVLWSENLKIDSLEILKDPKIKRIAMANPKLAPYGKASMEVLDHLKLTPGLKSKIVYGASVSQAHQFVATKNAQIGFGALSLIDKNLSYFIIDKALYSPIEQALIITKNGANNPLAKVFKDFLFSPKARAIFKEYGYIVD